MSRLLQGIFDKRHTGFGAGFHAQISLRHTLEPGVCQKSGDLAQLARIAGSYDDSISG